MRAVEQERARLGPRQRAIREPALPKDLPTAIKYLNDGELDRLLRAAMKEAERRWRRPTRFGRTLRQALSTGRLAHQRPTSAAARGNTLALAATPAGRLLHHVLTGEIVAALLQDGDHSLRRRVAISSEDIDAIKVEDADKTACIRTSMMMLATASGLGTAQARELSTTETTPQGVVRRG